MGLFKPNTKKMMEQRDIPGLINALLDRREDVVEAALNAITRLVNETDLSDQILDAIRAQLNNTNSDIRGQMAFRLRDVTKKTNNSYFLENIQSALVKSLDDPDFHVCAYAARSLVQFGRSSYEALNLGLLKAAAAVQLHPFTPLTYDSDPRIKFVKALGDLGVDEAVPSLLVTIKFQDDLPSVTFAYGYGKGLYMDAVTDAIGKIGTTAVEKLVYYFKNPSSDSERQCSAIALRKIGDQKALEALMGALTNENETTRMYAAEQLGKLGNRCAVEPLILALQDKDWLVRCNAARALGDVCDVKAIGPLQAALQDPDEIVRKNSGDALSKLTASQH
jgi:HEAT repeat protein